MRGAIFRLVVVAALVLIPFFIYQEVANATQRCNDGTFSNTEPGTRGACSGHGGVDKSWRDVGTPEPVETPKPNLPPTQSTPEISIPVETDTFLLKLASLSVDYEFQAGYDRDSFDYDYRTTRQQVLKDEYNNGWYDQYNGKTYTESKDVHIDHRVPLHEAWSSGAHAWSPERKVAFGNDTTNKFSLEVVSRTSNLMKGAKEPHEWMPATNKCLYLDKWVDVKYNWNLNVDPYEKWYLERYWRVYCE